MFKYFSKLAFIFLLILLSPYSVSIAIRLALFRPSIQTQSRVTWSENQKWDSYAYLCFWCYLFPGIHGLSVALSLC